MALDLGENVSQDCDKYRSYGLAKAAPQGPRQHSVALWNLWFLSILLPVGHYQLLLRNTSVGLCVSLGCPHALGDHLPRAASSSVLNINVQFFLQKQGQCLHCFVEMLLP